MGGSIWLAVRMHLPEARNKVGPILLITPPLTLTSPSFDLIFVGAMLTLMGVLLFHEFAKRGEERWKSPTTPMIFCLVMVVGSIIVAKLLSLVE